MKSFYLFIATEIQSLSKHHVWGSVDISKDTAGGVGCSGTGAVLRPV